MFRGLFIKNQLKKIILIVIGIGFAFPVLASDTNGTIDSTYRYAWGENIGWIDFGTTNGNVHVTDSALSGYALSETVGWIYLDDVDNDGSGNLSGYAWSENTGYIDFAPSSGGVIINSSGEFTGSALSETVGWIIFSGDYSVKTDWRPRANRAQCNNSTDDDSDGLIDYPDDPGCSALSDNDETDPAGAGLSASAYSPPAPPAKTDLNLESGFKVIINNNQQNTKTRNVVLSFVIGKDTKRMAFSNTSDFSGFDTGQVAYQSSYAWDLCPGEDQCLDGEYAVYAKFYTQYGYSSEVVSDTIVLTGSGEQSDLGQEDGESGIGGTTAATIALKKEVMSKMIEILQNLINLYIQLIQLRFGA